MARDPGVWKNIVDQIENKIAFLVDNKLETSKLAAQLGENQDFGYDLTQGELAILNQIKCHVLLNGKKLGLKSPFPENLPLEISVEPYVPFEGGEFCEELEKYLKMAKFDGPKTIDFYQTVGSKNLESTKRSERICLFLNDKSDLFLDTFHHNSYIRLRRDHLNKLGHENIEENEIDENNYHSWKTSQNQESDKIDESDENDEQEILFQFQNSSKNDQK